MGKIYHTTRIGISALMIATFDGKDFVQMIINRILGIMPKDTIHISTERQDLHMVDTSIVYLLTFEHPIFEDGTKIELDYIREAYASLTKENHIEQVLVLTGVKYIKPDGTSKYK